MGGAVNIEGLLDDLADRVADRLAERFSASGARAVSPRLLTVEQAAGYLGRSKASVQHMVSERVLPTVRSDRRVFLDIQDLDRWIDRHKKEE
jgi:excisionase family DNA binding protein